MLVIETYLINCLIRVAFLLTAISHIDATFLRNFLFLEKSWKLNSVSCRVISGICQDDSLCISEIATRFPNCYIDSHKEMPIVKTEETLLGGTPSGNFQSSALPRPSQHLNGLTPFMLPLTSGDNDDESVANKEKRAPAMKLMNILMAKDRIPVG